MDFNIQNFPKDFQEFPINAEIGDIPMTRESDGKMFKGGLSRLAQSLAINGQRIKSVPAGLLPAQGNDPVYMHLRGPGTWTFGGNNIAVLTEDEVADVWWQNGAWTLDSEQSLPRGEDGASLLAPWQSGVAYDINVQVRKIIDGQNVIFVNDVEGNTNDPESENSGWSKTGGSIAPLMQTLPTGAVVAESPITFSGEITNNLSVTITPSLGVEVEIFAIGTFVYTVNGVSKNCDGGFTFIIKNYGARLVVYCSDGTKTVLDNSGLVPWRVQGFVRTSNSLVSQSGGVNNPALAVSIDNILLNTNGTFEFDLIPNSELIRVGLDTIDDFTTPFPTTVPPSAWQYCLIPYYGEGNLLASNPQNSSFYNCGPLSGFTKARFRAVTSTKKVFVDKYNGSSWVEVFEFPNVYSADLFGKVAAPAGRELSNPVIQ